MSGTLTDVAGLQVGHWTDLEGPRLHSLRRWPAWTCRRGAGALPAARLRSGLVTGAPPGGACGGGPREPYRPPGPSLLYLSRDDLESLGIGMLEVVDGGRPRLRRQGQGRGRHAAQAQPARRG